ncbi:hypothetical protein [Nocardia macrotermitis]|uniref:Uncharacterized protein n=1 Tax=Nocardia macrotermitis TaxID=2585198 RepID=A0A7K0D5B3_9NOCA|nr:hypothetical protein [Nocardia macrotermitis]MQY20502.1 hypothetical protein [Nocardia macrotermitis]
MTLTAPGPLDEPMSGGPGFRANPAAQIERFHHPATRILLASEGLTTTALEHLVGCGLNVRVSTQDEIPAAALPAFVATALRLRTTDRVVIRHSRLVTPERTISINYVAAPAQSTDANGLADLDTPIGHGLIARGLTQRRRIMWAGTRTWPDGRPCAARAYVMSLGGRPVSWIREAFDPDVIRAEHTAATTPEPELHDEPGPPWPGPPGDPTTTSAETRSAPA